MKRWSIVAAIFLGPAALAGQPEHPTAAFRALPQAERNLAVYDAFWTHLEKNHYDPQMLSRAEVRALREQGRKKAAALDDPSNLYGEVLNSISTQLPDSRIEAEPPPAAQTATSRRYSKSPEEVARLAALLTDGPGFDDATMRRGSRKLQVVTEVRRDSPAAEAGVRPGWRIVNYKADTNYSPAQSTGEFLPLDARAALAWERGDLSVAAPDPSKVVRINFAHYAHTSRRPFESRRVGKGVHYLRFDGFGDDETMRPVFQAIRDAGPNGLIIDLRWNAGGPTPQAQRVAGALLGDGVVMGYRKNAAGSEAIHTTRSASQYEGPLVLLIGPTSSSSSEILAAAIQDHHRGKLVGRMTNGSLSTASVFPLPDGGSMSLPTWDFRSSARKRLEGVGVTPDVRVLPTLEDVRAGRDSSIERAVLTIYSGRGGGGETLPQSPGRRGEMFPPI